MEKFEEHNTNGARNMVGKKKGVSALINEKVLEANDGQPMQFHWVIHQQALCGKVLNWRHVMSVVVSNMNFIKNHALNHRQFQTFLADLNCEHGDVMYHNEVRWLSSGKVLRRFFQLRKEINEFLKEKGKKEEVDLIADSRWLRELAFLSDNTEHLNILNMKLKGKYEIERQFAVLPKNVDSCFQLELIELLASIFKVARFAQGVRNSRVLFINS